jgi:hypothetical protein
VAVPVDIQPPALVRTRPASSWTAWRGLSHDAPQHPTATARACARAAQDTSAMRGRARGPAGRGPARKKHRGIRFPSERCPLLSVSWHLPCGGRRGPAQRFPGAALACGAGPRHRTSGLPLQSRRMAYTPTPGAARCRRRPSLSRSNARPATRSRAALLALCTNDNAWRLSPFEPPPQAVPCVCGPESAGSRRPDLRRACGYGGICWTGGPARRIKAGDHVSRTSAPAGRWSFHDRPDPF